MENPNEYQLKRDHKHDLAFRPLETALEKGVIDAMYSQSKVLSVLSETTGKFKSIEDLLPGTRTGRCKGRQMSRRP